MKQRQTQVLFSFFTVYSAAGITMRSSVLFSLSTSVEWHLVNDCYGKMSRIQFLIESVADVPICYVCFYKRFCHFILDALSSPFALKLYYSLHSFCIFERFFCLHFHTLPLFFFPLFFFFFFCFVKTPRKAVLFHEYQASTGRFNKFVSLLAASLFLLWSRVCVYVPVTLVGGHPC